MSQSTTIAKPEKPTPDFPLFPHATRRWAKKIRGKTHYFGGWSDPDGALAKYEDEKADLYAGREPRNGTGSQTIRDLANGFLNAKRHLLNTGEITPRTFHGYFETCERLIRSLGRNRLVDDVGPDDFQRLRAELTKAPTRQRPDQKKKPRRPLGPVALGNEVQRVRSVFKYAFEQGLIGKPVLFGQGFKKPSAKTLRQHRAKKVLEHGKRMFSAGELRSIIDKAGQPLKAMILLGMNCGLGNADCAALVLSALDLEKRWLDFPRPKTGVDRRCPLWPETVKALREALAMRPKPKNPDDAARVFITRLGKPWVRTSAKFTPTDRVGEEFAKLLRKLKLKRPGLAFYALRHGFETVAGESRDQVAVDAIMGHVDSSMAARYREGISDARLRAVTDHVRDWLFPKGGDA